LSALLLIAAACGNEGDDLAAAPQEPADDGEPEAPAADPG
jgi:hypothetical protein